MSMNCLIGERLEIPNHAIFRKRVWSCELRRRVHKLSRGSFSKGLLSIIRRTGLANTPSDSATRGAAPTLACTDIISAAKIEYEDIFMIRIRFYTVEPVPQESPTTMMSAVWKAIDWTPSASITMPPRSCTITRSGVIKLLFNTTKNKKKHDRYQEPSVIAAVNLMPLAR